MGENNKTLFVIVADTNEYSRLEYVGMKIAENEEEALKCYVDKNRFTAIPVNEVGNYSIAVTEKPMVMEPELKLVYIERDPNSGIIPQLTLPKHMPFKEADMIAPRRNHQDAPSVKIAKMIVRRANLARLFRNMAIRDANREDSIKATPKKIIPNNRKQEVL